MSEKKESPHGKGRYGEKEQRDLLGGVNLPTHRRRLTSPSQTGPGMFDVEVPQVEVAQPQEQPQERKYWFKKGSRFYSLDYPVPRSPLEEENRRAGSLDEPMEISIDPSNLTYSDKLKKWTVKAKKEHKSTLYGAFVIGLIETKDRNGEVVLVRRFISLKDLQKPEDNPYARFKKATS
jgi:hypothetical protein